MDIPIRLVPAYCVYGEVRDTIGSLVSSATVAVEQGSWPAQVLNEGGRFLLTGLPSGSYMILIQEEPHLGRVFARRIVNVGAADTDGLVITVTTSF